MSEPAAPVDPPETRLPEAPSEGATAHPVGWAWARFALALTLAVLVAAGIGWNRFTKLEPQPDLTLTAGDSVEFRGLRLAVESFEEASVPEDLAAVEVPEGAVWIELVLRQEVLAPAIEEYEMEWYCSIELITERGTWQSDTSTLSAMDQRSGCTAGFDRDPFSAGEVTQIHGLWLIPEGALVEPRVLIQFGPPPGAIEVRPLG
ncbi:MAG: hypothetical protein Q4G64_01965 [bacterium]|nr:hypothetical protein [bacterium]